MITNTTKLLINWTIKHVTESYIINFGIAPLGVVEALKGSSVCLLISHYFIGLYSENDVLLEAVCISIYLSLFLLLILPYLINDKGKINGVYMSWSAFNIINYHCYSTSFQECGASNSVENIYIVWLLINYTLLSGFFNYFYTSEYKRILDAHSNSKWSVFTLMRVVLKSTAAYKAKVIIFVGTTFGLSRINFGLGNKTQKVLKEYVREKSDMLEDKLYDYTIGNSAGPLSKSTFCMPPSTKEMSEYLNLLYKPHNTALEYPWHTKFKISESYYQLIQYKPNNFCYQIVNLPNSLPITNNTLKVSNKLFGTVFDSNCYIAEPQFASSVIEDFQDEFFLICNTLWKIGLGLIVLYCIVFYKKQFLVVSAVFMTFLSAIFFYYHIQKFPADYYDSVINSFRIIYYELSTSPAINSVDTVIKTKWVLNELVNSIFYWKINFLSVTELYQGLWVAYHLNDMLNLSNSEWVNTVPISDQIQFLDAALDIITILAKSKHGVKVFI